MILFGKSMGAAAVLRAISDLDVRPDAAVLESCFNRLLTTTQRRFYAMGLPDFPFPQLLVYWGGRQAGYNGFNHNPEGYAAHVQVPVLLLQGARDPYVWKEDALSIFYALGGKKRLCIFESGAHADLIKVAPEGWRTAVSQFMKEYDGGLATPLIVSVTSKS